PVSDGIGKYQRLAIDDEVDIAEHADIEPGRRNNDVGSELLSGLQQDTRRIESLDFIGHHRCLAIGDALEQVGLGHEGNALAPRTVPRREMGFDIVVGAEQVANDADQFLADKLWLGKAAPSEGRLIEQDLAAYDLMDPALVDLQLPQRLGQVDGIAAGHEKSR